MASVTFTADVGGDGSTVTDDTNATTGLAAGGHRTRFVPALAQVVAVAARTVEVASVAVNSPGTAAYAANSLTIGLGSKSFTVETGKAFVIGQFVIIASTSGVSNWMGGQITFYETSTGIMTVNVTVLSGAGTFSGWIVSLSGPTSGAVLENVFTITDGPTVNIDPGNGGIQVWTLGANRTPTATNFTDGESVTLMIADGSAFAVTWTTMGVVWVLGAASGLPTSGYGVFQLWKVAGTIYGVSIGPVA